MNGMAVHYSRKTDEWETPADLFEALDAEFHFTLDPCCTHQNAKCDKHFTLVENGLAQSWAGESVFMNPPYGRQVGRWIQKALGEVMYGRCSVVVCLIPARTDTAWWHNCCMKGEIRFLRGRLCFSHADGTTGRAPFPSAVVIFNDSLFTKGAKDA